MSHPDLLAQLLHRTVVAPTVQAHGSDQRPELGRFQSCMHRDGCRYLDMVATDAADVSLACGRLCYDAVRER